jgi:enamine deaminase RidA (YjgF/YER057c/UK114 family)
VAGASPPATQRLLSIDNGVVFLDGLTSDDGSQDMGGQTRQVLANINEHLVDGPTDKSRLITAQIWLKKIARDFAGMKEILGGLTAPNEALVRATAPFELVAASLVAALWSSELRDFRDVQNRSSW